MSRCMVELLSPGPRPYKYCRCRHTGQVCNPLSWFVPKINVLIYISIYGFIYILHVAANILVSTKISKIAFEETIVVGNHYWDYCDLKLTLTQDLYCIVLPPPVLPCTLDEEAHKLNMSEHGSPQFHKFCCKRSNRSNRSMMHR